MGGSTGFADLVAAMHAESITVSTVGLGSDVNHSLLQQAASVGGGRAYFTSDPRNVPRIFVRETTTMGQNSAVEELVRMLPAAPADFLRGVPIEQAPMLRGYLATRPRPAPAQVVLASDLGEPLLARLRVGLGWTLAFTSDLKPRWAADLLRWRALPSFVGQLVREHMRRQRHDELPMRATMERDELVIRVDAISVDDRFLDGLESSVTIEGSADATGRALQTTVALPQSGPGRYEARTRLDRYGSFALHAVHRQEGRVVGQSHAQVSHPYPVEYDVRPPDRALLESVSKLTSGRRLDRVEELFDPRGEHILDHEELWPRLVLAALLTFLVDLFLRRVPLRARGGS